MRHCIGIAVILLLATAAVLIMAGYGEAGAQQGDVQSLQEAHRRYLDAWSERDLDTIVEMGTGAAGFGHSTAFPRPVRVADTFREGVKNFYAMMDVFTIRVETEHYRVVGDTGLAWGHYAAISKQKDGPRRTIYQRYAHTFVRTDDGWRLVMYHRSLVPTEDTQ